MSLDFLEIRRYIVVMIYTAKEMFSGAPDPRYPPRISGADHARRDKVVNPSNSSHACARNSYNFYTKYKSNIRYNSK